MRLSYQEFINNSDQVGKNRWAMESVIVLLEAGRQEWAQIRGSLESLNSSHETLARRVLMIEDWSHNLKLLVIHLEPIICL